MQVIFKEIYLNEYKQVRQLRARVDLEVMAMKGYSSVQRSA